MAKGKSAARARTGHTKRGAKDALPPNYVNADLGKGSDGLVGLVPVVAIGASAGGLAALERMFDAMPIDTGLAFIIVQHLSPDFRSMMDELLARRSRMPIKHASDSLVIHPNTIYLNPPRQNLHITGNRLDHVQPVVGELPNHPIDAFFASLAADRGNGATGVILSGTGNDGTRGAMAILAGGGTVIVQEPGSAQFENMPRNAIEKGAATATALPEDIAALLAGLKRGEAISDPTIEGDFRLDPESAILLQLDRKYGVSFGYYKKSTVRRRLHRRASLSGMHDLANYAEAVREEPEELDRLYADLLIGVTAFFRDRAAFDSLAVNAVPTLAKRMTEERALRIWVPACASGEEAYSIAIQLAEYARINNLPLNVKIFGTDLHNTSVSTASQGIYPAERLKEIDPDIRDRYFKMVGSRYQAKSSIRRLIVFSQQNLIKDPPFTRLDLISCRNMLIYLDEVAQRKVLALFHFALVKDGTLFLGPSETLGEIQDEFETVDSRWRLYRKLRDVQLPGATRLLPTVSNAIAEARLTPDEAPGARPTSRAAPVPRLDRRPMLHAYDALLARYAPPGLLITRYGEILHIFGSAQRFVRLRAGVLSLGMADVIIEPLKLAAGACLDEVRLTGTISGIKQVTFEDDGKPLTVQVRGEVLPTGGGDADQILITLTEYATPIAKGPDEHGTIEQYGERKALHGRVDELERNLRFTEESLQTTIEELETSNEELQSTNEELMSANEELQSTNEELHAVNEELYSISSEHQRKIHELTVLTNDMDHLLRCSDVGTLFLDKDLRVRRFTPAVAASFNLLERDVGRPIGHITARFNYPALADEVARVAATGDISEQTIDAGPNSMLLRIFPFKAGDVTDGVVITIVDVSQLKQVERALAARNEELGRLITSLQQFTRIVSHDLRAPLRAISNSAKWIVEDLGSGASEEIRSHCDRLTTSARRLIQMLDDLREYARLDVGDKQTDVVDITELMRSIVEAIDGDGRLALSLSSELGSIRCQRTPLRLVLQNLLDNALKHGRGPEVTVEVTAEDVGDFYRFSVSDNGVGIPMRHHAKIFLPFHKLERNDDSAGTGMGLTLVRKAIEDNGGKIEVISDPPRRKGTTFRFTWAKSPE